MLSHLIYLERQAWGKKMKNNSGNILFPTYKNRGENQKKALGSAPLTHGPRVPSPARPALDHVLLPLGSSRYAKRGLPPWVTSFLHPTTPHFHGLSREWRSLGGLKRAREGKSRKEGVNRATSRGQKRRKSLGKPIFVFFTQPQKPN